MHVIDEFLKKEAQIRTWLNLEPFIYTHFARQIKQSPIHNRILIEGILEINKFREMEIPVFPEESYGVVPAYNDWDFGLDLALIAKTTKKIIFSAGEFKVKDIKTVQDLRKLQEKFRNIRETYVRREFLNV